jgi:hypothetical protein
MQKVTAVLTAVVLIFAFSLHAVQVSHEHHANGAGTTHTHGGSTSEGTFLTLAEQMHQGDKKLIFALLAAPLMVFFLAHIRYGSWIRVLDCSEAHARIQRILFPLHNQRRHSYLLRFFRRGLLNPKPY